MIIESLIKMFSQPAVPPIPKPVPPSVPGPAPAPQPAPQPAPGNPGSGFPAFTCNCYCPPVYYPAPPQQTPRAYQQPEDPWGIYTDSPIIAETKEYDDKPAQLKVPHSEIPS
jgi:hypothetical protein